jgi:hypothetical protein
MGRFVWQGKAADGSHWASIHPHQQLLNSGVLLLFSWITYLYAMAGFVFGYLPFFVGAGFVPLQGLPAILVALGSLAMALAMATHLLQRHWSGASASGCQRLRSQAWWAAGISMSLAMLALILGIAGEFHALLRPRALHPDADWMLSPLPWAWSHVLPLARVRTVNYFLGTGVTVIVFMLLFMKLNWSRLALILLALLLCLAGGYFLGDAALGYAASRGVAPVGLPESVREWRGNPGLYNAWLWLAWWGGLSSLTLGVLLLSGCILLPAHVMDKIDFSRR